MKISLEWLSEHVDLGGLSTDSISHLLTFAGIEVEQVEGTLLHEKIVVAEVLEWSRHPDADSLSVCKVDHGTGSRQIVCGASNFRAGDRVPLALPGAILPNGTKIKKGKLRGVTSDGMMCSGAELGIACSESGLLLLGCDAPIGVPIKEVVSADTRFTIEITPNRPDWLSHRGIARELAAITGRPLKEVTSLSGPPLVTRTASASQIVLDGDAASPYYTALVIRGVQVAESPDWLKKKLEAVGLRPINNVVDVTNFVLMEMGQPLHAFDRTKLNGGIHVRRARQGETITPLYGTECHLISQDTVIADASCALAIAGIMGGAASSVTHETVEILLESAYFVPEMVRQTSRRLGICSDSSYRFERGADPKQALAASALAAKMIQELTGGIPDAEVLISGQAPQLTGEIELSHDHCRRLLGVAINDDEIKSILTRLGLEPMSPTNAVGEPIAETSRWLVPSYRLDLHRPVDLIEEVVRLYGLDRIPSQYSAETALPQSVDWFYDISMRFKRRLVDMGFYETPTLSMVSERQVVEALSGNDKTSISIKNPLGSDYGVMRTSLLSGLAVNDLSSGLLNVASRNANLGASTSRLFEVGPVYGTDGEQPKLALLVAGDANEASWLEPRPHSLGIYDLRGILDGLIPGTRIELQVHNDPNRLAIAADVTVAHSGKQVTLGWLGLCKPSQAREIGYDVVAVAELGLRELQSVIQDRVYHEISPYPGISRDIAMEVDATASCRKVEQFFREYQEPLLEDFRLFDVFTDPTGEKLDPTKKSFAFSVTYRSTDKTLTSETVDKVHAKLLTSLQEKLGVSLR